jgi:glycyl-tRNA synthetase
MSDVSLDEIVSLCKRRGFIYQGSEIYGGLAGTWDYGPLGVALKRNLQNLWWKLFVDDRDDMYGVDAAILMNQKVWQASGHVDTFTDPLVECNYCHTRFRYDQLIPEGEYRKILSASIQVFEKDINDKKDIEELAGLVEYHRQNPSLNLAQEIETKFIEGYKKNNTLHSVAAGLEQARAMTGNFSSFVINRFIEKKCEVCGRIEWDVPKRFNMMFKTNVGPVDDESSVSYLRPETAQGIFTNFKNVVDSFYPDVPFGIAQIGKAFRNEISPRDFVFRSREFEQMEIEYFIHPDYWKAEFEKWVKLVHEWCRAIGLPEGSVHELEVPDEDRAHYSKRTIDFEFDYPIGRKELLGLAYRTDFDLGNIQRASGKNMEYRPKDGGAPFVPHVIEPSFGVERAFMAVLVSAYTEDEQNGEKRAFLKLPYDLAPVKVAVSPLLKNKPELVEKAREVYAILKKELGNVMWDDNGNIGKRYRRQDEIGTPHCVTIDFDTMEDNTVTVRNRDTTEQERVKIEELNKTLEL